MTKLNIYKTVHTFWVKFVIVKSRILFSFLYAIFKVVRYSKGQKMSNFTFDARSQQWLVQWPQKFILLCFIWLQ